MSVGRGQGVKYSNVKVSSFKCSSPKTVAWLLCLAVLHPGGWLRHLSELPVTQVVIPALCKHYCTLLLARRLDMFYFRWVGRKIKVGAR